MNKHKNCPCKYCKKWRQYGGKILGQGTYGCVYDEVFSCKNTAKQIIKVGNKNYATKVVGDPSDLTEELSNSKKLYNAEKRANHKKGTYFVGVEGKCEIIETDLKKKVFGTCRVSFVKSCKKDAESCDAVATFTPLLTGNDYVRFNFKKLSRNDILKMWIHLYEGLKLMHKAGIVHFDIKNDNIFINKEGSKFVPKFVDFGLSFSNTLKGNALVKQFREYDVEHVWDHSLKNLKKNYNLAISRKEEKKYLRTLDSFSMIKYVFTMVHSQTGPAYKKLLKDFKPLFDSAVADSYLDRPDISEVLSALKKDCQVPSHLRPLLHHEKGKNLQPAKEKALPEQRKENVIRV